jgi:hypothetical protein
LAEISRAFNREFYYTPVVLVFKYQDNISEYLAFANTERLKYKQEWREGEKAGKVSLLRDINIKKPHRGHEDIINQLKIPTSGTKQVDSFAKLYTYWQEVFSVSILNKKFYKELQNWYFWAIQEVSFPNQPNILDENIDGDETKLKEAIKEHKGKNVIRLLTRILFIWFIKEKKLIPEEIFDEELFPYRIEDRTELISNIQMLLSESTKESDKYLMESDIELLEEIDDVYVFSSFSTNEYIYEGCDEFNETCRDLLYLSANHEKNKAIKTFNI